MLTDSPTTATSCRCGPTLAERLADPAPIDPDLDRSIREALLSTLRADLAIAKPGYDATTGAP